MNTTSMVANKDGNPYIASYWRKAGAMAPQYHLIYNEGNGWQTQQISSRTTTFGLSGAGTKRIPISRPQLLLKQEKEKRKLILLYRDAERDNKVSASMSDDLTERKWAVKDLTDYSVGLWEPTYDTELWKRKHLLALFVQNVEQGDTETIKELTPKTINVLKWNLK